MKNNSLRQAQPLSAQRVVIFLLLISAALNLGGQTCTCTSYTYSVNNTTWTGGNVNYSCIHVTGTMTVNSSVSFNNCQFKLDPGASIQVSGAGQTLSATYCCFSGITGLWNTIDIAVGSTLNMKNCIVQDANYGVTAHQSTNANNQSSIILSGSKFFNNVVGVEIPTGSMGSINLIVNATEFYGSGYLLGTSSYALTGIEAWKVININVSSSGPDNNYFHNLKNYGIHLMDVEKATCAGTKFKYINATANSTALYYRNNFWVPGNLSFIGLGSNTTDPFCIEDCYKGIYVIKPSVIITDCNIRAGLWGIMVENSRNKLLRVHDNRIEINSERWYGTGGSGPGGSPNFPVFNGIAISYNNCAPYGNNSQISLNHILVNSYSSTPPSPIHSRGISVTNQYPLTNPYPLLIESNYINVNSGHGGIEVINCDASVICANYIVIVFIPTTWASFQYGISVKGASNHFITCNSVLSNDPVGQFNSASIVSPIGMMIENTHASNNASSSLIDCNYFEGLGTGLHFDQDCQVTDVVASTFQNCGNGIICGPNNCKLKAGGQSGVGNAWYMTPPSGYYDAIHLGGLIQVLASEFFIKSNDPTQLVPPSSLILAGSTWFFYSNSYSSGTTNYSACSTNCSSFATPPLLVEESDSLRAWSDYYSAKLIDSSADFQFTDQWLSNFNYLKYYTDDSTAIEGNNVLWSYYNSLTQTELDDFVETYNDLFDMLNDYDSELDMLYQDAILRGRELEIYDSTYQAAALVADELPEYDSTYLKAFAEMMDSVADKENFLAETRSDLVYGIIDQAGDLPEDNANEWNAKKIWRISAMIESTSFDTLTTDDLETIEEIAKDCPMHGGPVVYTARCLWQLSNDTLLNINDLETCDTLGYFYRQAETNFGKDINIKVYPNPTNGILEIQLQRPNEKISIACYDLMGREMLYQNETCNGINCELNMGHLTNGIYIIQVRSEEGTIHYKIQLER